MKTPIQRDLKGNEDHASPMKDYRKEWNKTQTWPVQAFDEVTGEFNNEYVVCIESKLQETEKKLKAVEDIIQEGVIWALTPSDDQASLTIHWLDLNSDQQELVSEIYNRDRVKKEL